MARTQNRSTAPVADETPDELLDGGEDSMDLSAEFDEDGEDMPSTNGTNTGAKDTAPRREYDDEGYQLNKKGVRDSRWKAPIWDVSTGQKIDPSTRNVGNGSASNGSTDSTANGKTRAEKVVEIFGKQEAPFGPTDKGWEFVSVGSDPNGRKSPLGANLKDFTVIKDKDGNELIVGKGEAAKFAGVTAPRKERETTRKTQQAGGAVDSEFAEAFDDADDGTGVVAEGDDLDTGDELLTDDDE